MFTSASLIGTVLSAILALGALPASSDLVAAEGPRPVEKIRLTTSTGAPTSVGAAAIGDVPIASGKGAAKPLRPLSLWLAAEEPADAAPLAAGAEVLTAPLEVSPFQVAGLTWSADSKPAPGQRLLIRVREGEIWSEWHEIECEEDTRPDGAPAPKGTEPFVTGGADGVQVLVAGGNGAPADLTLALMPANPEGEKVLAPSEIETTNAERTALAPESDDEAAAPEGAPQSADASQSAQAPAMSEEKAAVLEPEYASRASGAGAGALTAARIPRTPLPAATTAHGLTVPVVTRAEWGAPTSEPGDWETEYAAAPFVVVHHTAGTNNYTCDQSAGIVKGIYNFHANSLGWSDIGYNFLVDKCGRAFEGRWGTLASPKGQMAIGGHSRGFNTGTMGISMIGDYTSVAPSSATLTTVGRLSAWQLARAGVAPDSSGVFVSKGNKKYPAGTRVTLPRISGHRDNGYTECPGAAAYPLLPKMRRIAVDELASAGTPASPVDLTGEWRAGANGWRFLRSDGSYATNAWARIGGKIYAFDADGAMRTGWYDFHGAWYYLDPTSGAMRTGALALPDGLYLLSSSGAMTVGWAQEPSGWRYYDSSGRQARGWVEDRGAWYFLDRTSGIMRTGRLVVDGATYFFDPSGAMAVGWSSSSAGWRYYAPSGAEVHGWARVGDRWYYLDPTSGIMRTGRISVGGSTYVLDASGARLSGWWPSAGDWYYLRTSDGAMLRGWTPVSGAWYLLDASSGRMRTGWVSSGGAWYYLDASGAMRTGWVSSGGAWYFLDASGAMRTGWVSSGGAWYFLDGSGAIVTGARTISGTTYRFAPSGALL